MADDNATATVIKPFSAQVNASGQAIVTITHFIHGLTWTVRQIGFALGQLAPSPQIAAHVNGAPLSATVTMQPSVFSQIAGEAPYAMESFMVGPPYIDLESGDQLVCAVLGAISGDTFYAAAYVSETQSDTVTANAPIPYQLRRW